MRVLKIGFWLCLMMALAAAVKYGTLPGSPGPQHTGAAAVSVSCADRLTERDLRAVRESGIDPCLYLGLKREFERGNGR
jgi:hypothetical protein